MSCGAGRRHSSDLMLLWLWWRPADAAVIRPLAWELPYAAGVDLKSKKRKKEKKCHSKSQVTGGLGARALAYLPHPTHTHTNIQFRTRENPQRQLEGIFLVTASIAWAPQDQPLQVQRPGSWVGTVPARGKEESRRPLPVSEVNGAEPSVARLQLAPIHPSPAQRKSGKSSPAHFLGCPWRD